MTPDLLIRIGEALYGPRWKSDMARDLGVHKDTVQDWCNGRMTPRPGVLSDLGQIIDQRIEALRSLRPALEINP